MGNHLPLIPQMTAQVSPEINKDNHYALEPLPD